MLYLPLDAATGKPVRIQGAYVSEKDINAVVGFLKKQAEAELRALRGGEHRLRAIAHQVREEGR